VISVFGSNSAAPGSADYELAREVGGGLALAGFAVATGGYSGTMAGASQGAAEAGGVVIGVTCGTIVQLRQISANPWVTEEVHYTTLEERLLHLVKNNVGMIVLPGGIGTLSEFALAWSFLQTAEMPSRPLVVVGDMWANMLRGFGQPEYVPPRDMELVHVATTAGEAVDYIRQHAGSPLG
jgi:uncharacterized protein (TIGR00730 family)